MNSGEKTNTGEKYRVKSNTEGVVLTSAGGLLQESWSHFEHPSVPSLQQVLLPLCYER